MTSSADYYQYLKYVKNTKVQPAFLNEGGGATASIPMSFNNHNISLQYDKQESSINS